MRFFNQRSFTFTQGPLGAIIWTKSVLVALVCISSCSDSAGLIQQEISLRRSPFQVLNLTTGDLEARQSIPDLLISNQYRTTHMVFALMPQRTSSTGEQSTLWQASTQPVQGDEAVQASETMTGYLAVFELTQGQWAQLETSEPWLDAQAALTMDASATGVDRPAFGLTLDEAELWAAQLNQLNSRVTLRLPTAIEWEVACRAGASTAFSWGDSDEQSIVAAHAVLWHTRQVNGPHPVADLSANSLGFYDMHGNVWEYTADGFLRGGSWRDSLAASRAANRLAIDHNNSFSAAFPTAGMRLMLLP